MKQLFNKLTLISAVLAVTLPVAASEIPSSLKAKQMAGLMGDPNANQEAIKQLRALLENNKKDALVMALLGSSEAAQANYEDQPWQKMELAEKGMAHLDKSLVLAKHSTTPADVFQVTTTAACTFIKVPKMFNRLEQGYGLIQGLIASASFAHAPLHAQVGAYLCGIESAIKSGHLEQAQQQIAALTTIAPEGTHMTKVEQLKSQLSAAAGE